MLFFSAKSDPKDESIVKKWIESVESEDAEDNWRHTSNAKRRIQRAIQTLPGITREETCFVVDMDNDHVTFGVAAPDMTAGAQILQRYAHHLGLGISSATLNEITYNEFMDLASTAETYHYLRDSSTIQNWLELEDMPSGGYGRRRGLPGKFAEFLLEEPERERIFAKASTVLMQSEFIRELERIYAPHPVSTLGGHPVHYMLASDDKDTGDEATCLLLEALLDNERITGRRVCVVGVTPRSYQRINEEEWLALYHMNQGGAIVVDLLPRRDETPDEFVSADRMVIEDICRLALMHRNEVLTIMRLPASADSAKNTFKECLGGLTLVELCEEPADIERAREYLCALAKERTAEPNEELFTSLDPGKGYNGAQLTNMFEDWYSVQLKTSVYPQYNQFSSIANDVLQDKPKGTPYEELQQMIGLDDVKEVVENALNYYKYQSVCVHRGIGTEKPAMHMCFTGSPGTAKTTVARLFAKIMRDNHLLASGQCIEVGRGDLVGKYVGWTAQQVQQKFREARGGVLFIDEAYSLVDDRDGMFGDEAINTIVQEMENYRDKLIVILAGYPDKMEGLLDKNPGLRSRIAYHVHFPDYNEDELVAIAQFCASEYGIHLSEDTEAALHSIMARGRHQENFGNGRFVRNVIDQGRMRMASRLATAGFTVDKLTDADLTTMCAADLQDVHTASATKRTIGFCS